MRWLIVPFLVALALGPSAAPSVAGSLKLALVGTASLEALGGAQIFLWNSAVGSGNITIPELSSGAEFSLSVNITRAPEFDSYQFNLEYHPSIIEFVGGSFEGTIFWPDIGLHQAVASPPGRVLVLALASSAASGDGSLLFARFRVLQKGFSVLSITSSAVRLQSTSVDHRASGGCFSNRPPRQVTVDFSSSPSPAYYETSEYMLGKVAVGIILPESLGPHYNWTDAEVSQTVAGVKAAMHWWASQEPVAGLVFTFEEHIRVPTTYEPIEMGLFQDYTWVGDVMNRLGYGAEAYSASLAFNNALRTRYSTDWAFTIFVVDSDPNVNQGLFVGGGYAHVPSLGGSWITMSRLSPWAWNYGQYYPAVPAHETGHIFRATDEYNGVQEYEGYLWVPDADGTFGIMNQNNLKPSVSSEAQMGLVDCDADGIADLLDTQPAIQVNAPNIVIAGTTVRIDGRAVMLPYPSYRPGGRDITIGKISSLEYSVDGGVPLLGLALDGAFDEALEEFHFDFSGLSVGPHAISVKAVTSVGNSQTTAFTVEIVETISPAPELVRAKLSWVHRLRVSSGIDQVFTAAVDNPSRFNLYVYVQIDLIPTVFGVESRRVFIVDEDGTGVLLPANLEGVLELSTTVRASLLTPAVRYDVTATIWYSLLDSPVGVGDGANGYLAGNSKTGSFSTA